MHSDVGYMLARRVASSERRGQPLMRQLMNADDSRLANCAKAQVPVMDTPGSAFVGVCSSG